MHNLKTVNAAGGLTIDLNDRVLFIFKDGRWDLPKGLVERKHEPRDTAVREVSEETGLPMESLRVLTELIPTIHVSKYEKTRSLKHTQWFLLRCNASHLNFRPQKKEGIEHCEWIPQWDLDRTLVNCPERIRYLVHFWTKIRRDLKV